MGNRDGWHTYLRPSALPAPVGPSAGEAAEGEAADDVDGEGAVGQGGEREQPVNPARDDEASAGAEEAAQTSEEYLADISSAHGLYITSRPT